MITKNVIVTVPTLDIQVYRVVEGNEYYLETSKGTIRLPEDIAVNLSQRLKRYFKC